MRKDDVSYYATPHVTPCRNRVLVLAIAWQGLVQDASTWHAILSNIQLQPASQAALDVLCLRGIERCRGCEGHDYTAS